MSPPTRTGATGAGGGSGGAVTTPPTMPPATPPGTPFSNPGSMPERANSPPSRPVSGVIDDGASIGAAIGVFAITGAGRVGDAFVTMGFTRCGSGSATGGGGGGGGGTGAATKNAIVSRGSGRTSVAYSVDSTSTMITATCPTADSAVVVQRWRGTPDDGLTMVWNMRSLLSSEPAAGSTCWMSAGCVPLRARLFAMIDAGVVIRI